MTLTLGDAQMRLGRVERALRVGAMTLGQFERLHQRPFLGLQALELGAQPRRLLIEARHLLGQRLDP